MKSMKLNGVNVVDVFVFLELFEKRHEERDVQRFVSGELSHVIAEIWQEKRFGLNEIN